MPKRFMQQCGLEFVGPGFQANPAPSGAGPIRERNLVVEDREDSAVVRFLLRTWFHVADVTAARGSAGPDSVILAVLTAHCSSFT